MSMNVILTCSGRPLPSGATFVQVPTPGANTGGKSYVSYPSIALKECTIDQMQMNPDKIWIRKVLGCRCSPAIRRHIIPLDEDQFSTKTIGQLVLMMVLIISVRFLQCIFNKRNVGYK